MLNFEVESKKLLESVTVLSKVSNKSSLSVLNNIEMSTYGNTLTLKSTNLYTNIIVKMDIVNLNDTDIKYSVLVPAKSLLKCIKKIEIGVLSIRHSVEAKLSIQRNNSKDIYFTPFSGILKNYPEFEMLSNSFCSINTKKLNDSLVMTLPSVSDDETRYFLNGVLFETSDDRLKLVSTDGRRLTYSENYMDIGNTLIQDSIVAPEGLKLYTGLKNKNESTILYRSDDKIATYNEMEGYNIEIQNRIIDGQFPQYRRITTDGARDRATSFEVKELKKAFKKLDGFYDKKSNRVTFNFTTKLCIEAGNDEDGTVNVFVKDNPFSDKTSVVLNVKYLNDIVKSTLDDEVTISFNDGYKPCFIEYSNGFTMIQPMMD